MLTLQLPQSLEHLLQQTAKQRGITTERLAVEYIEQMAVPKSYANGDFNFDLQEMKEAVEAPSVLVPKFDTDQEFLNWLNNLTAHPPFELPTEEHLT